MARLLRDIIALRAVRVIPPACEYLAQHGVQRLLDTRGFDVPAAEVEFCDGDEALDRIFDVGDGEENLRVRHEVCYAFEHGAWFEDESWERDTAEVCAGSELGDDVHEHWTCILVLLQYKIAYRRTIALLSIDHSLIFGEVSSINILRRPAA